MPIAPSFQFFFGQNCQCKQRHKNPKTLCLLRDEQRQYKYTAAQEEALEDELNEIYEDESTVYIEHEYVQDEDIPKTLHRQLRNIFTGFVIKPKEEEKPKATNLPSAKKLIEQAKLK